MESLANKYRPRTFDEVVGQENVVKVLKKELETNTLPNCILLTGPSGVSKTTNARIIANQLLKGVGTPIEIDAASNNGVDDVRNLIESSNTKSLTGGKKVIIVDEAHSITTQGWQAFLKTLEEPNSNTIFIFCTTEVQKIPTTILNRVQRFDLTKIDGSKMLARLRYICQQENFSFEEDALNYIVKSSQGRMRDAIANLDKVSKLSSHITFENCVNCVGGINHAMLFNLVNAIFDKKTETCLKIVQDIDFSGRDLKLFINDLISFILDINKYLVLKNINLTNIPSFYQRDLDYCINIENPRDYYFSLLQAFIRLKEQVRYEMDVKANLEITLISLCK